MVRGSRELTLTLTSDRQRRMIAVHRPQIPHRSFGHVLRPLGAARSPSGPTFWTIATSAEFLRGTSDGVFVSLEGVVTAGPAAREPADLDSRAGLEPRAGADGTLWAGTGGDGRVLRVRPGQPEERRFDADETNIFALAVSGNRMYAATSPDGRVYVIEGTAAARPFFDPEEKYIWALAVDGAGRLWVGAGNPAVIYRVDANGTSQAIYKPPAAHVVSLARDGKGRMLAGTESPGRLYRIRSDDRPFVLLDSGLTEVRAVTTGRRRRDLRRRRGARRRLQQPIRRRDHDASRSRSAPPPSPAPGRHVDEPPAQTAVGAVTASMRTGAGNRSGKRLTSIYDLAVDR